MNTSEQINELAAALAKAQGEMKNAKLNKTNPHFRSKYADIAEIRDTVTPSLSANGIAVVHGIGTMGDGLAVTTRLIHTSGQWVESAFPIPYDKPQTMGSAITYGRRYNMSALCNIAADEDDDGNAGNNGDGKPETSTASKAVSRPEYEKMVTAIRAAATVKALNEWQLANAKAIERLPADWFDSLQIEFMDRRSELSDRLAT